MSNIVDNILECGCGELLQLDPDGQGGCQWIHCRECGESYCGTCGSTMISNMDNECDEDYLWCNKECLSCGCIGCGECV